MQPNVKEILDYVCRVFDYYGVTRLTPEEFRQSKFDKAEETVIEKYFLMINELILLHLGDFKFRYTELQKNELEMIEKLPHIKKFVLFYLKQLECPFVISEGEKISMITSSSRYLLLVLGWLMERIDLFERYTASLVKEAKDLFVISPSIMTVEGEDKLLPNQASTKITVYDENEILSLYKIIKQKYATIQKLYEYQNRKLAKIKEDLNSEDAKITLEEFFFIGREENFQALEDRYMRLNKLFEVEISNIKQRELFWSWLESVVELDKKEMSSDPDYGFSDEINRENVIIDSSCLIHFDKMTEDFKLAIERYTNYREKFDEFIEMWNEQSQILKTEKYAKLANKFKEALPMVIKDLEKRYPSLDSLQNNKRKGDLLLGEIKARLESLRGEEIDETKCDMNTLNSYFSEVEEEFRKTRENIQEYLQQQFEWLSREIEIFPKNLTNETSIEKEQSQQSV